MEARRCRCSLDLVDSSFELRQDEATEAILLESADVVVVDWDDLLSVINAASQCDNFFPVDNIRYELGWDSWLGHGVDSLEATAIEPMAGGTLWSAKVTVGRIGRMLVLLIDSGEPGFDIDMPP